MHVVLINGPAGSGKTFFASALREKLFEKFRKHKMIPDSGVCTVLHCGFKEPLREMLFQFAESAGVIDFGLRTEEKYLKLKDTMIAGFIGREWQITWGTAMRAKDQDIFSKILLNKLYHIRPQVAVVDDLGFQHELSFAVDAMQRKSNGLVTIYLDGYKATKTYKDSQQFDNDSRVCLRDRIMLVNPTIESAADYIIKGIQTHRQPALL